MHLKYRGNISTAGGFISVILFAVFVLFLSWLFSCGVFAIVCWALRVFNITTISNWTVKFSWKAGTAFWLIALVIRSLFKPMVTIRKS